MSYNKQIQIVVFICVHWVPKRTTPFLHPADQSWMTPLKHCGITSRNPADYGSQLRHFIRSNELVDTIVNDEMGSDDIFGGDGDEWDEETRAILDSESEDDENEQ